MTTLNMLRTKGRFKPTLFSLGLLFAITACNSSSDDNDTDNPPVNTDSIAFTVAANGAQEMPAVDSSASASGTLTLDQTTGALSGSVSTSGITTTASHLHEGYAGANGDVIIALAVNGETITVPDETVLTADQQVSLLAGSYYLNIHSAANPGGEIRSQLAPAGVSVMQLALAGSNEVPAVASEGTGTAYITVNDTSGVMVVNVSTTGLTTPNAAHLHGGFAGGNGGVLQALVQDTAEVGNFQSSADATLSAADLATLQNGGIYVNVHTDENPSGELRGQVLPEGVSLLNATLSGDQEVPAVITSASGSGIVTLNENASTVTAIVSVSDAPTANAGHIHEGAVGVNGDVVVMLTQNTDDSSLFSASSEAVTAAQIATFKAEGMYFNIHTPENPGGEIRGQLLP